MAADENMMKDDAHVSAPNGNKPARQSKSVALWLAASAAVLALLLPLVTGVWCALHWDTVCFRWEAFRYRVNPEEADIYGMSQYVGAHWQGMTEDEVIGLFGQPAICIGDNNDAHSDWVHIPEWLAELGLEANGSEHVLWYNERGPPVHWPGDETMNFYFLIRDGKVIRYFELFP